VEAAYATTQHGNLGSCPFGSETKEIQRLNSRRLTLLKNAGLDHEFNLAEGFGRPEKGTPISRDQAKNDRRTERGQSDGYAGVRESVPGSRRTGKRKAQVGA